LIYFCHYLLLEKGCFASKLKTSGRNMDDTQATADNAPTTGDASAEVSTQVEQGKPDLASRVSEIKSADELAKLTQEFFETEGKGTPEQAEAVADEVVADETATADTLAADEVEAGKEKAGEEENAQKLTEQEEEDSPLDPDKLPARSRVKRREDDKVGKLADALQRRNRDWTLEQALVEAKQRLGVVDAQANKPSANNDPVADGLPQTVEAVQEKLKELRAAKSKAMREELDLAKADDLDIEMDKLRDHVVVLKSKAQEDAVKAADEETRGKQKYFQEFNASQSKASGLYNFLSDDKSAGFARAREIDQQLEANGDPTHWNPNKPLIIAQMVAAELRIAPKSAKAPVKSPVVVGGKPTVAQKPASVISSGGSRTVAQSSQTGQELDQIKSISSIEELRKLGVNLN
jgi:hypothetical protein